MPVLFVQELLRSEVAVSRWVPPISLSPGNQIDLRQLDDHEKCYESQMADDRKMKGSAAETAVGLRQLTNSNDRIRPGHR